MKLKFDNTEKRTKTLSVRLSPKAMDKLNKLAQKHKVSKADIIEKLILMASES
ncbi:CopG family transcriptional regulator [Bdellovibrio bacteriovorus]|uniref:ribbon-helix-helix domain-containing protein n=1 Tax=Bdellovibrio bacteriovorus TaxID=959 RepID=UPI0035A5A3B2